MFKRNKGFDPSLKVIPDSVLAEIWGGDSSGGSPNGVTRYEWSDPMSFYWNDQDHGILPRARNFFNTQMDQYGQNGAPQYRSNRGQGRDQYLEDETGRIQSMDTYSREAIEGMGEWGRDYAANNGSRESANARNMTNNTLNGMFTNPAVWNGQTGTTVPSEFERAGTSYQDAPESTVGPDAIANYQDSPDQLQIGANQYAGMDSPYFQSQLNRALGDVTRAYEQGTSADTRRMMNMAGIFGGGAHERAQTNNEGTLGRQLGDTAEAMRNSQYERSTGLAESDIGRRMQGGQFDIGNSINRNQFNASNQNNMNQFNAGLQQGARQFDVGQMSNRNQFNAGQQNNMNQFNSGQRNNMTQFDRNLQNTAYDAERNRQMGAVNQAYQGDEAMLGAYRSLAGAGDARTAYNQGIRNMDYETWQQGQEYPWQMFNRYGNILGQAQGGLNATQTTSGGQSAGISPLAGLLGAGAMYGAFRG